MKSASSRSQPCRARWRSTGASGAARARRLRRSGQDWATLVPPRAAHRHRLLRARGAAESPSSTPLTRAPVRWRWSRTCASRRIRVLETTDFHGAILAGRATGAPTAPVGGSARARGLIARLRAREPRGHGAASTAAIWFQGTMISNLPVRAAGGGADERARLHGGGDRQPRVRLDRRHARQRRVREMQLAALGANMLRGARTASAPLGARRHGGHAARRADRHPGPVLSATPRP